MTTKVALATFDLSSDRAPRGQRLQRHATTIPVSNQMDGLAAATGQWLAGQVVDLTTPC